MPLYLELRNNGLKDLLILNTNNKHGIIQLPYTLAKEEHLLVFLNSLPGFLLFLLLYLLLFPRQEDLEPEVQVEPEAAEAAVEEEPDN